MPSPDIRIQQQCFSVFGHLPMELDEWLRMYSAAWIREAVSLTESAGVKSPRYTYSILRRFAQQGGPDKPRAPARVVRARARADADFRKLERETELTEQHRILQQQHAASQEQVRNRILRIRVRLNREESADD